MLEMLALYMDKFGMSKVLIFGVHNLLYIYKLNKKILKVVGFLFGMHYLSRYIGLLDTDNSRNDNGNPIISHIHC